MKEVYVVQQTQEILGQDRVENYLKNRLPARLDNPGWVYLIFPYHKIIREQNYQVHLKMETGKDFFGFSFDLTKPESQNSLAWIDCYSVQKLSKKTKRLFGEVNTGNPTQVPGTKTLFRPLSAVGIFVDPAIRQNGVATTLITCTRITLDNMGITSLVIKGVGSGTDDLSPKWKFYQSLNPHVFDSNEGTCIINGKELHASVSRIILPAKPTCRRPYVFK